MFTTKTRLISAIVLSVACLNSNAESVSGHSQCTYKPTALNISNTDGYAVMMSETSCDFSGGGFNDGATVSNPEVANLHQGTGEHSGYYTLGNGSDSTIAKWSGNVTTVMKDGNPMTSFKGKWEYVGGTGKFAGVKGKGEYAGHFISANEYVVDWKGNRN
jgi:hypothetical protein